MREFRRLGLGLMLTCLVSYFGGLHPVSGSLGGFLFFLTGWISTDLFWIGMGLACTRSGSARSSLLIVLAIYCLSAVPVVVIKASPIQPEVVIESLAGGDPLLSRTSEVGILMPIETPGIAVGRWMPEWIGSDEGCMCFYFLPRSSVVDFLKSRLNWTTSIVFGSGDHGSHRDEISRFTDIIVEIGSDDDRELQIRIGKSKAESGGQESEFLLRQIPADLYESGSTDERGLGENFWRRAALNFLFGPLPARLANRIILTPIERGLQHEIIDRSFERL